MGVFYAPKWSTEYSVENKLSIGGDILWGGVPFSVDVKWEKKEKEHDDRGRMNFFMIEKGGDCWMRLSLMSKIKNRLATHHQQRETNQSIWRRIHVKVCYV